MTSGWIQTLWRKQKLPNLWITYLASIFDIGCNKKLIFVELLPRKQLNVMWNLLGKYDAICAGEGRGQLSHRF
jgi:hypothetical protein